VGGGSLKGSRITSRKIAKRYKNEATLTNQKSLMGGGTHCRKRENQTIVVVSDKAWFGPRLSSHPADLRASGVSTSGSRPPETGTGNSFLPSNHESAALTPAVEDGAVAAATAGTRTLEMCIRVEGINNPAARGTDRVETGSERCRCLLAYRS